MTIHYRGPRALISEDAIATADTQWSPFTVAALSRFQIVRAAPAHRLLAAAVLGVGALGFALVSIPVESLWPLAPAAFLLLCALVLGALARHVRWELHAVHTGADVLLFASADRREFDQFCRAVRRALERSRDLPHSS